jgi:bifunctional DNase/RNase
MFQILPETSETRADRIFDRGRGRKTGWFLVFDHPLKAIRILAKASDETCSRSKPVVEVQIRGLAATSGACAVFLGNEDKVFVIYVEQSVGVAIAMFKQGTKKERPLTHDLLANILRALGAKIERVIVNDLKGGTYFARLVLSAEDELKQKKIIEIDARPSDCIAMATAQRAPIYVSLDVWDELEDMTEALRKMQEEGSHTEESDEEEES